VDGLVDGLLVIVAVTDQDLSGVELGLTLGLVEEETELLGLVDELEEEEADADTEALVLLDDVTVGVTVVETEVEVDGLTLSEGLKEGL
jgi:hypothetical protein